MNFSLLLGKRLKSDELLEVLEHFDMPVIYDFDRTHENIPDQYWAAAQNAGFQFGFNDRQILDVIFLYLVPREGFEAIDRSTIDAPIFETFDDAARSCAEKAIRYRASSGEPGSSSYKWWIKLDFGSHTTHYQYDEGRLVMITLQVKEDA